MMIPIWVLFIVGLAFVSLLLACVDASTRRRQLEGEIVGWANRLSIEMATSMRRKLEREQYRLEVAKLREAIRKHMSERGHNRCWLDDLELYAVLDPKFDKMNLQLPPLPEFIHNCCVFWKERQPEPKP